jgi:phage shock protein E
MKTIKVDVRSIEEWEYDGHAQCSINIPLDQIPMKLQDLMQYEEVDFVCRSGGRAGIAQSLLSNAGHTNVQNLGPWQTLVC